MGRADFINNGGASGKNDSSEAVVTEVINERTGGTGLIFGPKAFQQPGKSPSAAPCPSFSPTSTCTALRLFFREQSRGNPRKLISLRPRGSLRDTATGGKKEELEDAEDAMKNCPQATSPAAYKK